jgi:hypothetical protein
MILNETLRHFDRHGYSTSKPISAIEIYLLPPETPGIDFSLFE